MTEQNERKLRGRIRALLIFFIVGLILSGLTAFPIETLLALTKENISFLPEVVRSWISTVYFAIKTTNANYPYLSYGTDWLAFAHIVIAVAFIGPLKDPVRNIWVIQFGMIACAMVLPLALIAGAVREIPFYWRIIDCSFGVIGIIPLYYCYKSIQQLEKIQALKIAT